MFAHSLEHAGGYAAAEALRVAATLLPDIVPFDHRRPASYPENGKVTSDGVGPHGDLLADFPYLGPPHAAAGPAA